MLTIRFKEKEKLDEIEKIRKFYGLSSSTEVFRFLLTKESRKIDEKKEGKWFILFMMEV